MLIFIDHLREHKGDIVKLDNIIQKNEIENHLKNNGFNDENNNEKINWIKNNGKLFREYLNTIKVAALIWYVAKPKEELTWEKFCTLEDRLNNNKCCLDMIHE